MPIQGNAVPPDPEPDAGIAALLRALVGGLATATGSDDEPDRVLLDTDLDGHRYVLIRMPPSDRKGASLSPREMEIVRLVAEGHPNKVIAAVLDISSWTVCTHVRRVFAKLGVNSRAAMVARLAELGGTMMAGQVSANPAPKPPPAPLQPAVERYSFLSDNKKRASVARITPGSLVKPSYELRATNR